MSKCKKALPFLKCLPKAQKVKKKVKIPISIDTYKSKVAKEALDLGCSMVNDISDLRGDEELAKVVVDYNVPICLMHMKGEPNNMQLNPIYEDVVAEICDFLIERAEFAISSGVRELGVGGGMTISTLSPTSSLRLALAA